MTNILKFLPPSVPDATHEFLWCSDKSGYMHLYLITARRPEESCNQVLKAECSVQQLTSGCWVVFGSEVSELMNVKQLKLNILLYVSVLV